MNAPVGRHTSHRSTAAPGRQPESSSATPSPALRRREEHYRQARTLFDAGRLEEAANLAGRYASSDPRMQNLKAVCLMRLGRADAAVIALRSLVCSGLMLRQDAPLLYKTNFAAALLLSGRVGGCRGVLRDICQPDAPAVRKLYDALEAWKRSLTRWQRVKLFFTDESSWRIPLPFAPGEVD